jgi:hypothetical protein
MKHLIQQVGFGFYVYRLRKNNTRDHWQSLRMRTLSWGHRKAQASNRSYRWPLPKAFISRLIKQLKLSLIISISHVAIYVLTLVLIFSWRYVFGAVKGDWLLMFTLHTTIIFQCSLFYSYYFIAKFSCNDD